MIILLNPSSIDHQLWQKFLDNHPDKTVFQSPEIFSFYQKVNNFNPFVFFAIDNDKICGVLLAVLIKQGKGLKGFFSSRVVIYGGPIIQQGSENRCAILDELLTELIRKLKSKSVFIQFRNFFEFDKEEKKIFLKHGFIFRERLNLLIQTKNEEEVWRNIHSTRKRQIKKGLISDIIIVPPVNEKEMLVLYDLLVKLYKEKVKKPLPEWDFFKTFYQFTKIGRLGIVRLIKKQGQIIGGIVAPVTQGRNIYEWYVVGLDKECKNDYPSILATWSGIEFGIKNHLKHFDFMGLGKPDKKYGVRDFKIKFGKEIVNYGRFGRQNKILYPFVEFAYNVLRGFHKV